MEETNWVGIIIAFCSVAALAGAFITRISKLETRADVCDEKHREHDKKFSKQDEINLKVDDHHVEVMKTLSTISIQISYLEK